MKRRIKIDTASKGVHRRTFLKAMLATGAAGMAPPILASPASRPIGELLTKLFGGAPITPSDQISIEMVELAEDGSVVPIKIEIQMEGVESITLIAEKNPIPLIGTFELGPNALPFIATRIKLAKSSRAIAVAKAKGRLYSASKFVRVIKGGCA